MHPSDQSVCRTPVQYYRDNPKASFRWCLSTYALILYYLVGGNHLPSAVDDQDFRHKFIPFIRKICNMDQGDWFASVVHPSFDKLVTHYARRWVLKNGLCKSREMDTFFWDPETVGLWFGTVQDVELWLRKMGKKSWWENGMLSFSSSLPLSSMIYIN